jgi:nitroreductase
MDELDRFEELARRRRTSLVIENDREVDPALIERLVAIAAWAPNHKRTWPWRFAVATGAARSELGRRFAAAQAAAGVTDEVKLTKTAGKYRRSPVVLVVGCAHHADPALDRENRDAVSAAIQNLLLGATAAGLASFWSTPPVPSDPAVRALCGFESDIDFVAVIYLGWPAGTPDVPQRPPFRLNHIEV